MINRKKIIKILGIAVLVILALGLIGFITINTGDLPSYEVEQIDLQVERTPERVERGKKLALMLCANCHKSTETGALTGTRMHDAPPEFGEIHAPNITQDRTHGIGDWTDGELLYLLRTGVKRDGRYAPPYMAKFPTMADEDLYSLIAFLRSDDPLVAADPTPDRPSNPFFLTKLLCKVAWKPFPLPNEPIARPDTSDRLALGKYLAHNLDCFSCHSADFKTNNFLVPEQSPGYFGGGNKPLNREGQVVLTSNLTPDPETGIGKWSEEAFIKAVKYGLKEGAPALQYPMTPYTALSDAEAGAIFHYLKTIPPIVNKVERTVEAGY